MPAMTNAEAYNILGVPNKAAEAVVKSAYKRLALQTHPDKNPNDPDASKKFHRISEAYKRIVDPSSFHDEDGEGEDISEQEMAAMFSMMFSDMFSGGAGGMESMMNEIWGDGDDDDDDEMEPGGMGDMFHMMEMMMNDDGGEYDDEDDEDCDDEDENDNFRAYVQSLPDGMGFNISGGQEKNRGKDKTMEKLMASMGLSQSAGDYYMESIGEEDDDENYSDDESARFNVGQIGRGMEKGLTQDQMMMLMQEMLMPSIDKSFASSSSQAKKKSSCKNGHNYGQYNPKVSGSSGAYGKKCIDEDDDEEGCWETDSDDDEDEEEEEKEEEKHKIIGKPSKNTLVTNNDRNPGKVKIPIPAPTIGGHNKSTIAGAKINPIDDEKISSVKNLSKVVELEQEENKEEKQKEKGEKTQSSSALTVGDRVLVNSRHGGVLMFIGEVHYAKGIFYGVVVDDSSVGKNNGVLKGREYFRCPERRGLMLRISDLELL